MSESTTTKVRAGDVIAAFLERCGVTTAFGIISIHNMPILDAFGRRNRIRFVTARGEQGAANMADGYARVRGGLGVVVTSTGTGAGNTCGSMVEAEMAGTPVLHLTGQIEVPYLDRRQAYIHEAKDQLGMLGAVSKRAFRVWSPDTLIGTLREAVRTALTPPAGPVSVEIPIDVQEAEMDWPADLEPLSIATPAPSADALDALAERLVRARRPLLWLGGGARGAGHAVARLVAQGFGVVTSVQGRGILPEDHPRSLGAFNLQPAVEALYDTCDAMLVVGSRLRGNETFKYALRLPRPFYQIDADPTAGGRNYPVDLFVAGDAALALDGLADRLAGRMSIDRDLDRDLALARSKAEAGLREALGPYNAVVDALQAAVPRDFLWVRDITVSNTSWGNRLPRLSGPRDGVHALGGGIGQGLPMAIGAALAADGRKTVALVGDGGFQTSLGELATAVEAGADIAIVLMNDRGYGVIRNIQDAKFSGRKVYADLHTPDFGKLAAAMGLPYARIADGAGLRPALDEAFKRHGPTLIEVDMIAIGPFARPFAGPPARPPKEKQR